MKIVIAPDSFKESLTAAQAAAAIRRGFAQVWPQADYVCVPMADGGEGTAAALVAACGGQWAEATVDDPLGRSVNARYGVLPDGSAVMEMAEASGLHLLAPSERNPLYTSSYGTGQLLAAALARGARQIILGIGGSATNDGGAGMAQSLGIRLLDAQGQDLPRGGGALAQLARIDTSGSLPALAAAHIRVACDVTNPLTGTHGASAVFGPQKGATPAMVAQLDAALSHFADVLATAGLPDVRQQAGSGAAGGLGFGLRAFLAAELQPGIEHIMAATALSDKIAGADLVITGEGRMDGQTAFGKVPLGVLRAAQQHGVPVIALAGSVGSDVHTLYAHGFSAIFPTVAAAAPLAEVLAAAEANLERTARQVAAVWQLGQNRHC